MNSKPSEHEYEHEYGYDGQFWLLYFVWMTLHNLLNGESWVVRLLISAGLFVIFGIYRYVSGRSYKMFWIMSIPFFGLAIISIFQPEMPFPGRTFFFVILSAAVLYHLWLFWKVGNIFGKRDTTI